MFEELGSGSNLRQRTTLLLLICYRNYDWESVIQIERGDPWWEGVGEWRYLSSGITSNKQRGNNSWIWRGILAG